MWWGGASWIVAAPVSCSWWPTYTFLGSGTEEVEQCEAAPCITWWSSLHLLSHVYLLLVLHFSCTASKQSVLNSNCVVGCKCRRHTGSGGRPVNCTSPSCLYLLSIPACPLAINVTLSYPPHTHMATGSCVHGKLQTHMDIHACTNNKFAQSSTGTVSN